MGFVEARDVIDQSQTAHLGANRLKHSGSKPILLTKRSETGDKLPLRILNLDEERQKNLLVVAVPRKQ